MNILILIVPVNDIIKDLKILNINSYVEKITFYNFLHQFCCFHVIFEGTK